MQRFLFPLLPLIVVLLFYQNALHRRRAANPGDRLLPAAHEIWDAAKLSCTENEFTDEVPLKEDILASLKLFGMGYGAAVACALIAGLLVGYFKWVNSMFDPWLRAASYLPPMSLLALVFLGLGIGAEAKAFIIFLAVAIPLTRSTVLNVQNINQHQIWNALTLDPSPAEMVWLIVRRNIEPKFIDDARLLLGTAWVYLISAELIASDAGLGYRINVASRNMNVAQILFYVTVIGLLAFAMDRSLVCFNSWKNRWAVNP